jgi:glucokinase-like ROK family protein
MLKRSDMMISVSKGQNNEDLMNINRVLIVQYLQRNGICTRAQLSKAIGLTQASISQITASLIENGFVQETGFIAGEKGRRSVGIMLNSNLGRVIGVKLSRRTFSVGIFDFSGNFFEGRSESFSGDKHIRDILNEIKAVVKSYLQKFNNIIAIGIAVPGPFQQDEGRIYLMTEMQNWESVSLKAEFEDFCEIPVIIRHDANSGALAEWWFSSQIKKRKGTLIYFLVGEGVGAGIIINGNLLSGDQGTAGEVGHISIDFNGKRCACGNYGCLEMYCSSIAFVKNALEALKNNNSSILNKYHPLKASTIFAAAEQNDELALELVKQAGRYIGYGVVNLINAYDPSTVVISNDMAEGGQLILDEVKAVVKQRVLEAIAQKVEIELSSFKNDPILYSAAAVAIDYCLKHPLILKTKEFRTVRS